MTSREPLRSLVRCRQSRVSCHQRLLLGSGTAILTPRRVGWQDAAARASVAHGTGRRSRGRWRVCFQRLGIPALEADRGSGALTRNAPSLVPAVRDGNLFVRWTSSVLCREPLGRWLMQRRGRVGTSLAAVTGATGTVIRLRRVEGGVETIGAATGHLEAINQITGTIHAVSSGIGNLHAPVPLTGEIHEVSGAAGIVYSGRVAVLVPGTSAGTSIIVTSPITRLRSCSGVTRGSSAVNGDLAPAVPLFADLVASSGTLADLTVGQEILFSGDTSATSLLSASLNAVISLNGALNTEGKITGLIVYVASLTGSALESSGAIGDLAGLKPLYGAINSGSSINGEICAVYSVNGTVSCESSVGGNLTAIVPLNTECTVTGGLNGVLAVLQVEHLTGAFSATGSCAGSISVTVRLETAIVSISEILGDLKSGVAFSSEVTPVSSVTGELRLIKAVELSGSISAVSINSGIANTRRSLTCEGAVAVQHLYLGRLQPIQEFRARLGYARSGLQRPTWRLVLLQQPVKQHAFGKLLDMLFPLLQRPVMPSHLP